MNKHIQISILLLLFSLRCLGANERLASRMPGRWQDVEARYGVLEFREDGTFRMQIQGFKPPWNVLSGQWAVLDNGRAQMDYAVPVPTNVIVDVKFVDEEMLISEMGKPPTRYRRTADPPDPDRDPPQRDE